MTNPSIHTQQFNIPLRIKYTFLSGIFWGIIIHLYMFTNKLPNIDEMGAYSNTGASLSSGRWFLEMAGNLASNWSMPWVNGFLGIFYLSLTACFVVVLLNFNTKISCTLVSLMIVSFPSVVSIYTYMFTSDAFFLSILLNAIAVYCIRKYKFGIIYGAVLLAFGLGIYQAFICFSAGLLVLVMIFDILEDNNPEMVFLNGVKALASLILGVFLYFIILKALLAINGVSLNSYQGINEMGNLPISIMPYQILKAYAKVILFFTFSPENFYQTPVIYCINLFIIFSGFFLFVKFIIDKKLYNKKSSFCLLLVLVILFPLAVSFIYIMAPKAWVHLIMKFQYCLIYVFIIKLLEYSFNSLSLHSKVIRGKIFSYILLCTFFILGFNNYLIANKSYFLMQSSYERLYAFYNKLSMRIESTEGYEWGQKLAIMGNFNGNMIYVDSNLIQEVSDIIGIITPTSALSEENCYMFLKTYIGMNFQNVSSETLKEIEMSEYYKNMPTYPSPGSIQIVNDICIVKMSETR